MNFKSELEVKKKEIEEIIFKYLPKEEGFAEELAKAMNYSMQAGGKRIRPLLLLETYRMFGCDSKVAEPFVAAIEMIHTSSLIHDDLPAIDNDEYRRGKKTTHAVFGEALGILSGDALLNYAYETACCAFDMVEDAKRVAKAMQILTAKTGINGMLGGQSVDVTNEGKEFSREMLDYIYENKTSALLESPMMIGAVLAGAQEDIVSAMELIGRKVGIAFQIRDDILDVISSEEELGKPVLSDEKNHKVTYVTCRGLEQACRDVEEISQEAITILEQLPQKNEFLLQLIRELVYRTN